MARLILLLFVIPQVITNGGLSGAGPSIQSLSPNTGAVAASVTITGQNLGASQGASTVTFNGVAATVTSWSAVKLIATVPSTTTGSVIVTVGSIASNALTFTVTGTTCTTTTANLTVATIQAAVNAATNGDTICLPAGSATWTTALTIPNTKAVTIRGAGSTSTLITHNLAGSMIAIIQITTHATLTTRITAIGFLGGTYDHRFIAVSTGVGKATWRVDHNEMTSTGNAIQLDLQGDGPGLIDHNTMTGGTAMELIHNYGDGTAGWTDDVTPGGAASVYVEDNTFWNGATNNYNAASCSESFDGAHTVIRYNLAKLCQFDQHGTAGNVGARWWEIYNNTFNIPSGTADWFAYMDIRAGSGAIFNNTKTGGTNTGAGWAQIREEDTGYPALYQVGRGKSQVLYPAYFFGNDAAIDDAYTTPTMVTTDRDVYTNTVMSCTGGGACTSGVGTGTTLPTTCTTGVGFWKTDAGGDWDTTHGGANDGALYKCTAANTWTLFLTPYTYPHPLAATP